MSEAAAAAAPARADRPGRPNAKLAAVIAEAGFSHAGLARRVNQLGAEHGLDLRYDKTSVTRWLRGQQPRGTTPALIAEVFTQRLGRRLATQDLGLDACAPVYAGLEYAATPAEAIDIASGLWRKDTGNQAELRKIAFTPAGLVVPSRDWLIGRPDDRVARGVPPAPPEPTTPAADRTARVPVQGRRGTAGADGGLVPGTGAAGPTVPHGYAGPARPGGAPGAYEGTAGAGGYGGPARPGAAPGGASAGSAGTVGVPRSGSGAAGGGVYGVPGAHERPARPGGGPGGYEGGAGGAGGAGVLAAAGQSGGRANSAAGGGRVGAGDVAAVRAVGDLFRSLDHAYGGGHARLALVRYLEHEAEPMLRGSYGEALGRRLFAAVADLTRLAGWTSYDIGAHGLAQRYFVQALRLAQAAGDRVYGGYVLVTMSRQAVYLGHGREAVQLARVAQQGVGTSAPPVVQALLHAAEARGHGLLGEPRACAGALARAERALSGARGGEDVPPWARFFDEAQLADEFAHCHRDLQQYRVAAQHAERSLQLRAPGYVRSRLFCRTVLAVSRLGLGEVDAACAQGLEAWRAASEMRSLRAAEYVRDFRTRLDPFRDTAAARTFHDRVSSPTW
ncbi:regulator [Actinacidiphila guanduensis]|uniref:regulator n=1 Tax=Actinacidiphila guanduensis TaxID=310781 RepID=UPI000B81A935